MSWSELFRDFMIAVARLVRYLWVHWRKDKWLKDLENEDKQCVALEKLLKMSALPWEEILARYEKINEVVLQTMSQARLPNTALYKFRDILRDASQNPTTRLRAIIVACYVSPPAMRIDLRGLYPVGSRATDTELVRSLASFEDPDDNRFLSWVARDNDSEQVRRKAVEYLKAREQMRVLCDLVTAGDAFLAEIVLEFFRGEKPPLSIVDAINSSWPRLSGGAKELSVQVLQSGADLHSAHRKEALLTAERLLGTCEDENVALSRC